MDNLEIYSLLVGECKFATISEFFSNIRSDDSFVFGSSQEIEFLANHFDELSSPVIESLSFSILFEVLSHEKLQIKDEDWLFDFILKCTDLESERIGLMEFLFFECLSSEKVKKFVEWSFEFHNSFTLSLWRSICDRLILPVHYATRNRQRPPLNTVNLVNFDSAHPMQGIVAHLSSKFEGNVHTQGIVTITSSTTFGVHFPHHLADLTGINVFNSNDQPNQWFCYDFRDRTINLTHYVICSYDVEKYNPRSWVIESSMDGKTWIENDRRTNVTDLRVKSSIRAFQIVKPSDCRFVRFRQIDTNHAGNYHLCLTSFEVFGSLIETNEK